MTLIQMKRIILILSVFLTLPSWSKTFSNKYCQFELPSGWECSLEGADWVCQSINKDRQKEAIIILTAKRRGSKDSLAEYLAYLKSVKTFTLPGGKTQVSEPHYAEYKSIHEHKWVDSLHMASEVPGFYTRYMATVKENLGMAVTFSVGKDFYDDYRGIFDKIVETLMVFSQKNIDLADVSLRPGEEKGLFDDNSSFIGTSLDRFGIGFNKKKGGNSSGGAQDMIWIILGAVIIGGFIYLQKLKKKKTKTKTKKKKKKNTEEKESKD